MKSPDYVLFDFDASINIFTRSFFHECLNYLPLISPGGVVVLDATEMSAIEPAADPSALKYQSAFFIKPLLFF
jgi:hypothetical protein